MMKVHTVRIGAVSWILTAVFFLGQIAAHLAWPAYGMMHNDISLLGATVCGIANPAPQGLADVCSPFNLAFNAGLALSGVFILGGAWLTWTAWPRSRLATAGLALLLIGGVGALLAGLFPFNVQHQLHVLGAGLNFSLGNLGLIVLGLAIRRRSPGYAGYSIATGLVCLVALLFYQGPVDIGVGRGLLERFVAYPQTLWFMSTGVSILAGRRWREAG